MCLIQFLHQQLSDAHVPDVTALGEAYVNISDNIIIVVSLTKVQSYTVIICIDVTCAIVTIHVR